jgi:hypothetical protein
MISDELREKLLNAMKKDPEEVKKEIEHNPQILEFLINTSKEAELEKNEKIRYINMNQEMQRQLEQKSKELKITQGVLIGAGILFLLSLLDNK